MPTELEIQAAAAAIANARAGRRGAPPIANVLEVLQRVSGRLHAEVLEDAAAALKAAEDSREPIVFTTACGRYRCTVKSQHEVVIDHLGEQGQNRYSESVRIAGRK